MSVPTSMLTGVRESHSEAETEAIAAELARGLSGGQVIFLEGDLGAGKTAFVRGLARGLGAPDDVVASPTFVIQTTYPCADGRLLHHADLYRLASELGAEDVGLFELPGERDVLAVEWAARMRTYPWRQVIRVDITHGDQGDSPSTDRDCGMKRLTCVLGLGLALTSLACPGSSPQKSPAPTPVEKERPPVILITIDTLRPDHMSLYGYKRNTTPRLAEWAKNGAVFHQAYTYWPKTRGSFVAIMTGRTAGESGYSPKHPELHGFNPTLAETLQKDGYDTAAFVDNANVAGSHGFSRGFKTYVEMWNDASLKQDEVLSTEEITRRGIEFIRSKGKGDGFFLWLHYVNPHAPYTPPAPFDTAFKDRPKSDPTLKVVDGFFGGVHKEWARLMPGKTRLSDFVNAYDGEIAYVDTQVAEVLATLDATGDLSRSTVVVSSDHGESLGEHDYYFDHGANLFDPVQRVPFIVLGKGATAVKSEVLVSTLDIMPTLLDAAHVSFPTGLAGRSVLPFAGGRQDSTRDTLAGENDRGHQGLWDARYKLIDETPHAAQSSRTFFDRSTDPRELKPRADLTEMGKKFGLALDEIRDREERSARRTRDQLDGKPAPPMTKEECERLKALGYVSECPH